MSEYQKLSDELRTEAGIVAMNGAAGSAAALIDIADRVADLEARLVEMKASRDQYCELLEASKTLLEQADPDDTAALMRLRACIDKHGVWPNEQAEQDGDYEACVRFMAEQAAEHVGLAPRRTPVNRADLARALRIADPMSESVRGMLEKVTHHLERSIALDGAHEEICRLKGKRNG